MLLKALALAALASTAVGQNATGDLVSVLSNQTQLTNLTSFLGQYPDLVSTLGGLTNITLLAPDNAAFSAFLNSSTAGALASDQSLVQAVLTYHVLNGTYTNITNDSFIPSVLQPPQYANVTGGQRVEARANGGNVTFLSGLLARSSVTSGSALNFSGGVIHIISSLLTLPQNISETAVQLNLTSAYGALNATNLLATVDSTPDVTVFVPNNDAFRSIGSALTNLTTEQIAGILQYHVVAGTVAYSTDLVNGSSVQTLGGGNVTIRINEDDDVFVNGARVVVPNVLVANGVVHVIDEVLNPQNATASAGDDANEGIPAFSGASSVSEAPYTTGVRTPTASVATESATQTAGSSSSSGGAWMPRATGAVEAAMLLGGAAVAMNW